MQGGLFRRFPGALAAVDKLIVFAASAGTILQEFAVLLGDESTWVHTPPFTLVGDSTAARRLYELSFERSIDTKSEQAAAALEELSQLLVLTKAEKEVGKVEVCRPRLRKLLLEALETLEAVQSGPLPIEACRGKTLSELSRLDLPVEVVREVATEVYRSRVTGVANRVPMVPEKNYLDVARELLGLSLDDVRGFHREAFGSIYEKSVEEAIGHSGVMSPEAVAGLERLRARLGLTQTDATEIFRDVVQLRLDAMMEAVVEAYEEAAYTKEALWQIQCQRGEDPGCDPSADGSGSKMGIHGYALVEGIQGNRFTEELTKVVDFYLGNGVVIEQSGSTEVQYPVTMGRRLGQRLREDIYGMYSWNAITCPDVMVCERWSQARTHVGGILGLGRNVMDRVLCRMASRWCGMLVARRVQEKGDFTRDDLSVLLEWVPKFFGLSAALTEELVHDTSKAVLQSRALRIINKQQVTPEDAQRLRDEAEAYGLELRSDLDLTKPQVRFLFNAEVAAVLQDPALTEEQKQGVVNSSFVSFGLSVQEAAEELDRLLWSRCRGCLVNAVADLLQGRERRAVDEMRRLSLVARFAVYRSGVELQKDWDIDPAMRRKLVRTYEAAGAGSEPDVRLLESILGLEPATAV